MARGQDVLSASTLQLCLRVVRKTLTLVDLRDLHTVPRTMLEGLRDQGKLVCRLVTPYREHLSQHFSVTYSRIGLPESYGTAD